MKTQGSANHHQNEWVLEISRFQAAHRIKIRLKEVPSELNQRLGKLKMISNLKRKNLQVSICSNWFDWISLIWYIDTINIKKSKEWRLWRRRELTYKIVSWNSIDCLDTKNTASHLMINRQIGFSIPMALTSILEITYPKIWKIKNI